MEAMVAVDVFLQGSAINALYMEMLYTSTKSPLGICTIIKMIGFEGS